MFLLVTVPLKLENAKQRRTLTLGVPPCVNVSRGGAEVDHKVENCDMLAPLGRFGVPLCFGATADTF